MRQQPSPSSAYDAPQKTKTHTSVAERILLFFAQTRSFSINQSSQILSKNNLRLNAGLFLLLVILVFATAFTDNGFRSIKFGSQTVVCMLILSPLTIGAFLFKPRRAFILGLIAGIVVMLHGLLMPTVYYEFFLLSPLKSLVLIPLTTTLLSVLFGKILAHTYFMQAKRIVGMAITCLVTSFLCLGLFLVTDLYPKLEFFENPLFLMNTIEMLGGPLWLQVLIDTFAILIPCLSIDALIHWWTKNNTHSLRGIFSSWLFMLIASSFMLTGTICYIAITLQCEANAEKTLENESNYLETMITEETFDASTLRNYHPGSTDTSSFIIGKDDAVIFSYDKKMIGNSFHDSLSLICLIANPDEVLENNALWPAYIHESSDDTLNELGNSVLRANEITEPEGTYELALILPMNEVYKERSNVMLWILIVTLILFGSVYLLTMRLIQKVVVDSFTETNKALKKIEGGNLDERLYVRTTNEFNDLSLGINATVESLQNALQNIKDNYERELRAAHTIQHSSLPQSFPPFPDLNQFDLYATMNTAKEVGGDFYDFFLLDAASDFSPKSFSSSANANRIAFVIADVSGKGMPAALFMMAAKNELRNSIQTKPSLVEAVETANKHLCEDNASQMFVTAFIALFNFESGELEFVNAGHNPPLIYHNSNWNYLRKKSGVFLGAFENAPYQSHTISLLPDDAIFLYTDGVTEAMDKDDRLFGEEQLEEALDGLKTNNPSSLIKGMERPLLDWMDKAEQTDDITMLALRFNGPIKPKETTSLFPATMESLDTVLSFVDSTLNKHGCPSEIQNQLKLCAEELFVNVAHYAYPSSDTNNPGFARIKIQTQLASTDEKKAYLADKNRTENEVLHKTILAISDTGIAFNPLEKEAPHKPNSIADATIGGLGIFLAKTIADNITYERNEGTNALSIIKYW